MRNVSLVWIGLALLTAGCSKRSDPAHGSTAEGTAAPIRLTLALDWVPEPEFGGFYAAREGGAFARHGLSVDIRGGGAGVPVAQMVATGQADFGTVGGDELVMARARGAELVAVFATFQTSPQGIMVHASRHLERLEQVFASGTLAMEPGLPYAAFLKSQFKMQGVKIVPYDGGVARFVADPMFAQQCFVTSEPIAAKKQGSDPQVFLVADAGYNPYATVVVTRRKLLAERPDTVATFVAAVREGWQAYLDDPGPTNQVIGGLNGSLDKSTLGEAAMAQKPLIATEESREHGLGFMSRDRWATVVQKLHALGIVDTEPAPESLFIAPRQVKADKL